MAKNMYAYLKSLRWFVSLDDVLFVSCELKREKLAGSAVRLKCLREMQGVRAASEAAWGFLAL